MLTEITSKTAARVKVRFSELLAEVSSEEAFRAHILVISGVIMALTGTLMFIIQSFVMLQPALPPVLLYDLLMDATSILVGGTIVYMVYSRRIRTTSWVVLTSLLLLSVTQIYIEGNPASGIAGAMALLLFVAMTVVLLDGRNQWLGLLIAAMVAAGMHVLWLAGKLPQPTSRSLRSDVAFSIIVWFSVGGIIAAVMSGTMNAFRKQARMLESKISDMSRVERVLREQEATAKTLLNAPLETVALLDSDGHLLSINNAGAHVLGTTPDALIGRSFYEILPPDVRRERRKHINQVFQSGEAVHFEDRLAGTFIANSVYPIFDEQSKRVKHVAIYSSDITMRVQAEQAIRVKTEDLMLINALNHTANSGNNLNQIFTLLTQETKRIFSCNGVTVYLRSEDGQHLIIQNHSLSSTIVDSIKKLTSIEVTGLQIPLIPGSWFTKVLQNGKPQMIQDASVIQKMMMDCTSNKTLQKFVSHVYKLLNIIAVITVPLISNGKVIGLIEISRHKPFEESDLERLVVISEQVTAIIKHQQTVENLLLVSRQNHLILTSAGEGIFGLDAFEKVIFANPATANILGWNLDEVNVQLHHESIHHSKPDGSDYPRAECPIYTTLRNGVPERVSDEVFWRKDGVAIPVEYVCTPIKEGDEITGVVVAFKDISDRRRVETALEEERNLLRTVIDNLPDNVYAKDTESRFIIGNNASAKSAGVKYPEELVGKSDFDFFPQELADKYYTDEQDIIHSGEPLIQKIEPFIERGTGKQGWQSTTKIPLRDNRGEIVGIVGIGRDITENIRAEEALRQERDKAQQYLDIAGTMFVVIDDKGDVTLVNQKGCEILGYREEEIVGKNWFENFIPERLRENIILVSKQLLAGEIDYVEYFENPILTKSGDERLIAWHNTIIKDPEGNIVSLLSSGEDITKRKQAAKALLESEKRYHDLFEGVPVGLYRTAPNGQICDINLAGRELLGYPDLETIQAISTTSVYINPEDQKRMQSQMAQNGVVTNFETQWRKSNGESFWVRDSSRVVRDDDGLVLYYEGSFDDISERKKAEDERKLMISQIHEQAQELENVMSTVPQGVLLLNSNNQVILANPVAKGDLAILAGANVGDTITHLGDHLLAELLVSPSTTGLWHEVTAGNRIFEIIARQIQNGSEQQDWVMVINDVTREREIQQRIQHQDRLAVVGQMAAGIAHDFNNILAVITLYSEMALNKPVLPPKLHDSLQTILQQTNRASDLIQQILDFSHRAVLERKPMDLKNFLKEAVKLLKRTMPENIEIKLIHGAGGYKVIADPTRVQQVIMNLVVNARDAMPDGGVLNLVLSKVAEADEIRCVTCGQIIDGEWISITVKDTGTGIPPDILPHIFEPFFTTKEPGQGTGLGLAQVFGIVKQHEGHIDVNSILGEGTTFTLYLPYYAVIQEVMESSWVLKDTPYGQGEVVLVVEDNAKMQQAFADILEMINYKVMMASNGLDALEVMDKYGNEIALVLSDMVMPEMGGKALFQALKENYPETKMIIISGHMMKQELQEMLTLGLDGYLSKPAKLEQLAQEVSRVINGESKYQRLKLPLPPV